MASKEDIKNLDLYKEIVEQNNRVTRELNHITDTNNRIATVLDKVVANISELNDENILHHTEINKSLKILTDKILYIVIILVIALALVAGATRIVEMLPVV